MKNCLKIIIVLLSLNFCQAQSMKLKNTPAIARIIKRHYGVNDGLAKDYLTSWKLSEHTTRESVIEASDNLKKYGFWLYAETVNPVKKEHIKTLLQANSLAAQERIKGLTKERTKQRLLLGINAVGVTMSFSHLENPILSCFFLLNTFFVIDSARNSLRASQLINAYKGIINTYRVIKEYDEKCLQEAEENKN